MVINASYIANNTGFWDGAARLFTQTGYLFPDGIIMVIALLGYVGSSSNGVEAGLFMASFWGFFGSMLMFGGGLVDSYRPIFFAGLLLLLTLLKLVK